MSSVVVVDTGWLILLLEALHVIAVWRSDLERPRMVSWLERTLWKPLLGSVPLIGLSPLHHVMCGWGFPERWTRSRIHSGIYSVENMKLFDVCKLYTRQFFLDRIQNNKGEQGKIFSWSHFKNRWYSKIFRTIRRKMNIENYSFTTYQQIHLASRWKMNNKFPFLLLWMQISKFNIATVFQFLFNRLSVLGLRGIFGNLIE